MLKIIRHCSFCGVRLNPFHKDTFTSHEYQCYKDNPEHTPIWLEPLIKSGKEWERRRKIAKAAALKRKKPR